MHEFHAWTGLAQSPDEGDDDLLKAGIDELRKLTVESTWHDAVFEVRSLNGGYFFTATGLVNRRRAEGARLDELLSLIAHHLPGSWGMVYERDDEMQDPPARTRSGCASSRAARSPNELIRSCRHVTRSSRTDRSAVLKYLIMGLDGKDQDASDDGREGRPGS